MNYNLEGEIRMGGTIALDSTLTLRNAAAQAKATGDAIKAVREIADAHVADIKNPHGVTKEQLGLGEVDNTSDSNKPVSKAQEAAIKTLRNEFINSLDAKVDREFGKELSSNDFTDADKRKLDSVEEGANKFTLEDGSVTKEKLAGDLFASAVVTLSGWSGYYLTVNVPGVTANSNVLVTPHPDSYGMWCECMVRAEMQGNGTLTFTCEYEPEEDLKANILIVG